jgi:hypothetical protein
MSKLSDVQALLDQLHAAESAHKRAQSKVRRAEQHTDPEIGALLAARARVPAVEALDRLQLVQAEAMRLELALAKWELLLTLPPIHTDNLLDGEATTETEVEYRRAVEALAQARQARVEEVMNDDGSTLLSAYLEASQDVDSARADLIREREEKRKRLEAEAQALLAKQQQDAAAKQRIAAQAFRDGIVAEAVAKAKK